MDDRLVTISRKVSRALRHTPEEYGLELDKQGFVSISKLLAALNNHHPKLHKVTRADLEEIIATSDKRRFEIRGDRIRALYGHSVPVMIERTPATPPSVLYHGTTHDAIAAILEQGLLPMGRQLVHLSADVEMAESVGMRRDRRPVILQVDASAAHADGIVFYEGNDRVWLAASVPARYLSVLRWA